MQTVESAIAAYQRHGRVNTLHGTPEGSGPFRAAYTRVGLLHAIRSHSDYHTSLNPDHPIPPSMRALLDMAICSIRTLALDPRIQEKLPTLTQAIDETTGNALSVIYEPVPAPAPAYNQPDNPNDRPHYIPGANH